MVGQRNEISRRLLKDNIITRENRKGEDQMNQARGGPLSSVSSFSFGPYILQLWMDYVYLQIYLFIYLHGMACTVHYATLDDTEWLLWPEGIAYIGKVKQLNYDPHLCRSLLAICWYS